MGWKVSKIGKKTALLTITLMVSQLAILILPACYTNPEFDDDLCGITRRANVTKINQVFFSPFSNGSFANENDTVRTEDFRFNIELEFEVLQSAYYRSPGLCLALDCEPKFNIQNVSNIQVLLRDRFMDFQIRSDISFLLKLPDGTQLSRFRDFSQVGQFLTLTFHGELNGIERMHTDLIVYFKNGEQFKLNSISPYLTN